MTEVPSSILTGGDFFATKGVSNNERIGSYISVVSKILFVAPGWQVTIKEVYDCQSNTGGSTKTSKVAFKIIQSTEPWTPTPRFGTSKLTLQDPINFFFKTITGHVPN